jgi:comEA protein
MLKRIAEWFALTKTERNVILFLAVTMFAGAALRLYQATFPSAPQFDYRASDSTFAALSAASDESAVDTTKDTEEEAAGIVNINTATKQQLMDLPGIGQVTADRILAYRSEIGKFDSAGDLRKVKGISKRKLEQLKPLITTQ